MKNAHIAEIDRTIDVLEKAKGSLEVFYAERHPEDTIVDDLRVRYDGLMNKADEELKLYTQTSRNIRAAVVTWHCFPQLVDLRPPRKSPRPVPRRALSRPRVKMAASEL